MWLALDAIYMTMQPRILELSWEQPLLVECTRKHKEWIRDSEKLAMFPIGGVENSQFDSLVRGKFFIFEAQLFVLFL